MKLYIPFNMIIDTDYGVIQVIDEVQEIPHLNKNQIKSFLLNRRNENLISEYNKIRNIQLIESAYDLILDDHYKLVLSLSEITDIIGFVINTHKFGLTRDLKITVGCDLDVEREFIQQKLQGIAFNCVMNSDIKLDQFDYIMAKSLDESYADYLLDVENLEGKRIYVADYHFNTLYSEETHEHIIDPFVQMKFESKGNILCLITPYNKKINGGKSKR